MKHIAGVLKQASYGILIGILISTIVTAVFIILIGIPWAFIYIEIGKIAGPYFGYFPTVLILICIIICIPIISVLTLTKIKRNNVLRTAGLSLIATLLTMLLLTAIFMQQASQAGQKIDIFIAENAHLNFHDYVISVSSFLDSNVQKAYRKPEAAFKIDTCIYNALLGPYVMQCQSITRADIIVYQGWGTCEQAAILIEKLLHDAGYETRQAYFKNIDHKWAEVKYNGTWLIIDPWYIGNFVEAHNLKNMRPEFQNATGVIVQYTNGTLIDASQEHGYSP